MTGLGLDSCLARPSAAPEDMPQEVTAILEQCAQALKNLAEAAAGGGIEINGTRVPLPPELQIRTWGQFSDLLSEVQRIMQPEKEEAA